MVRSKALKAAQERYEANSRKSVPVGTRVDADTLKQIDDRRGAESRSALVKRLLLEWLDHS